MIILMDVASRNTGFGQEPIFLKCLPRWIENLEEKRGRHLEKLSSCPNPVFRLATSIKMNTVFHTYRQNKEIILAKHFFPTKQAPNRLPAASGILNVDRSKIMIFTK